MIAVDFEHRNNILGKPEGMTDEECYGLPVHHFNNEKGYPNIISRWRFNKEDLERVMRTGDIWVFTVGHTLAPFHLQTENPFEKMEVNSSYVSEDKYEALSKRLPREIFDRIHSDIGSASMCWSKPESAGIFSSSQAAKLAFDLCHFVADELDKAKAESIAQ